MEFSWSEIEQNKEKYYNCLQAVLAYICNEFGKNAEVSFATCFGMRYVNETKEAYIGNKLVPNIRYRFKNFYEVELGMKIKDVANIDKEYLKGIIEKNSICVAHLDAYYCEWNHAYKEVHLEHYVIIKKINLNTSRIEVIDPYVGKDVYTADVDIFFKGIRDIFIVESRRKERKVDFQHLCWLLNYQKSINNIENYYKNIITDIESIKDINNLFEVAASDNNHLIISVKQLENNHYGILYVLWKQGQKEGIEIDNLLTEIYKISKNWMRLKYLLLKVNMRNQLKKSDITSIVDILESQKNMEIEVFNQIETLRNK